MNAGDSLAANPESGVSSKIEQAPEKQEDNDKQGNEGRGPSTKATTLTQLTHMERGNKLVDETASLNNEAEGSSSTEPTWGRIESSKERERVENLRLFEDLRRWESINVGGYASQRTTRVCRHGRCYMCSKPVSSTNLDPDV
jgi:hypothetical protein